MGSYCDDVSGVSRSRGVLMSESQTTRKIHLHELKMSNRNSPPFLRRGGLRSKTGWFYFAEPPSRSHLHSSSLLFFISTSLVYCFNLQSPPSTNITISNVVTSEKVTIVPSKYPEKKIVVSMEIISKAFDSFSLFSKDNKKSTTIISIGIPIINKSFIFICFY